MKTVLDIIYTGGMASPLLAPPVCVAQLIDVYVAHNGIPALAGVTLDFPQGRTTAIVGANGSGKSTLLGVLAGVVPVGSGSVLRDGRMGRGERAARCDLALVVQRSGVPDGLPLTVRDTVTMGRWAQRGLWRPISRADREIVDAALASLGLEDLADRSLAALSGGQRQRTLVAQGLAQRAGVLLLDEPTAGLDDRARDLITAALDDEVRRGATIIHVTHDSNVIDRADRVIRLEAGRVVD
jgi:zinc/manganese transport system ATP-binding protein